MKFLKKYILLIFLIENLLAHVPLINLGEWPFYIMVAIGVFLTFSKEVWNIYSFKKFKPLYLLAIVYIAYQFTVGIDTISSRTILYLVAKVTTFVIIIVSVSTNWRFYAHSLPIVIMYMLILVLMYGMISGGGLNTGERMRLGFGNVNETGAHACICMACALFFWRRNRSLIYSGIIILSLYSLLASGSRNSVLMLAIILIVLSRFSLQKSVALVVALLVSWFVVVNLPFNLAGVDRIKNTIEGTEGSNRESEVLAAKIMISEKPLTGWGFMAKNEGKAKEESEMGAHSGYLDTIKFMGYPFALLWFFILFARVISMRRYSWCVNKEIRYHMAIVLSIVLAAFFESYFVGVHEFKTNYLFMSLAVLSAYQYEEKRLLSYVQ